MGGEDATGSVPPVVKRGTRSGVADAPVYKKSKVDLAANEAFVDFGTWYAGGITTAEARDCTLDTSFLGMGEWTAEMFGDAGDAKEDAQRYVHETRKIKAGEKISVHMAPGGGFVIRFAR